MPFNEYDALLLPGGTVKSETLRINRSGADLPARCPAIVEQFAGARMSSWEGGCCRSA